MPENDLDFMNSNYVTQRGRCHHGHVEIVFVARHEATPCQSQRLWQRKVVSVAAEVKTNLWSGMVDGSVRRGKKEKEQSE